MDLRTRARWLLAQETRALLTRLSRVRPFVLSETMVLAAAPSPVAASAIERYLVGGRRRLRTQILAFLRWLASADGVAAAPADVQRRFTFLRMRFNVTVSQFDIFADVITQRSEHETGVWLSGLDSVAADALALPGYYAAPPVVCYLDRGHGAAIRRARTRLPGGGENPVAIIRMPRERMVGSGIASSLVHEVGHQASALLDLLPSLREVLRGLQQSAGADRIAWQLWDRWISEIVADFWSVARVGISATLGLIGVVSLPRPFVFRVSLQDPHPVPWIRVKLSAAMGAALYPHPQWHELTRLWDAFYPLRGLDRQRLAIFTSLSATIPAFVSLLVNHRPRALRGDSLKEVMRVAERQPARLGQLWRGWRQDRRAMRLAPPALVFAVIGQARADAEITPEEEGRLLGEMLTFWAMQDALDLSALCSDARRARRASHSPDRINTP